MNWSLASLKSLHKSFANSFAISSLKQVNNLKYAAILKTSYHFIVCIYKWERTVLKLEYERFIFQ